VIGAPVRIGELMPLVLARVEVAMRLRKLKEARRGDQPPL
jgi:hypothetical protein